MAKRDEKIVVIGGGTGSFTLLSGLKNSFKHITALVNMADDGGSSGQLRDELGVLPPGDVRQCLVALSQSPELRDLFNFRFEEGKLAGHSFGNLFLSAVEKMTGQFEDGVRLASEILRIQGEVLPISTDNHHLVLQTANGEVRGEYKIGHLDFGDVRKPTITLDPTPAITSSAKRAIQEADIVIIAPGNLYGSLAPALLVDGVGAALAATRAKVVYVCNLVTKPNHTDDFSVQDYADEIERFIGEPALDYVFYNTDQPNQDTLSRYTHEGEFLVSFDIDELAQAHFETIGLPLISKAPIVAKSNADTIAGSRSLIRHDAEKIAEELVRLCQTDTS